MRVCWIICQLLGGPRYINPDHSRPPIHCLPFTGHDFKYFKLKMPKIHIKWNFWIPCSDSYRKTAGSIFARGIPHLPWAQVRWLDEIRPQVGERFVLLARSLRHLLLCVRRPRRVPSAHRGSRRRRRHRSNRHLILSLHSGKFCTLMIILSAFLHKVNTMCLQKCIKN